MRPPSPLPTPEISAVRPNEAAAEAHLIERAFAAGPYGHLPKSAERLAFERDTAGRAASGTVLVARRDGRVVGTASVLRAITPYSRVAVPGEAEIRLLAVDPGLQGARLGEALMRASLERALEWGADALVLDTGARNTRAQALYERLGFARDPSREAGVSAGDVDSFVYRFALQQRADVRVRLMRADEADVVSALVESAYAADFELSDEYRASIAAVAERARDHQVWVAADATTGALLGTASTPRAGGAISPLARDERTRLPFPRGRRRGSPARHRGAPRRARAATRQDPGARARGAEHRLRHGRRAAALRPPGIRTAARARVHVRTARRVEFPDAGLRAPDRGIRD